MVPSSLIYRQNKELVKRLIYIQFALLLLCVGCEINFSSDSNNGHNQGINIVRYDRIETRYLTTGDFTALQHMSMDYPKETRTLIEDILNIGDVGEPNINSKLLEFFQDTTLQSLIIDVELQYADISDIEKGLAKAFEKLEKQIKDFKTPTVYAQIGALNQSIVVGDGVIGISLDKYLGKDYPLYKKFFTPSQREGMGRDFVVPDCLCFYLLSLYPLDNHDFRSQHEKDMHVAKTMWVVNNVLGKKFFDTKYVDEVELLMKQDSRLTVEKLLKEELK